MSYVWNDFGVLAGICENENTVKWSPEVWFSGIEKVN